MQVRPARSAPTPAAQDHGHPNVKKAHPKLCDGKEEKWDEAKVNKFKDKADLEDLMYVAISSQTAADNGPADGFTDWKGFNKFLRADQGRKRREDIIPGVLQVDVVLTLPPIGLNPTSPEGIRCVVELAERCRKLPAEACPGVLEPHPCIAAFCDGGEWYLLDQQIDGSAFEATVFPMSVAIACTGRPMLQPNPNPPGSFPTPTHPPLKYLPQFRPGGLHIVFMMLGALFTLLEDGGWLDCLISAGIFNSPTSAAAAMKGKHYARGMLALKKIWEVLCGVRFELHVKHVAATGTAQEKARLRDYLTQIDIVKSTENGAEARQAARGDESRAFLVDHQAWIVEQSRMDGTTFHVNSAIDAASNILRFIKASRDTREAGLEGWWGSVLSYDWLMAYANRGLYQRLVAIMDKKIRNVRATHGNTFADDLDAGAILSISRTSEVFSSVCPDLHLESGSNLYGKLFLTFIAARPNSWAMSMAQLFNRTHTVNRATSLVRSGMRPVLARRKKATPRWKKRDRRYTKDVKGLRAFLEDVGLTELPADPKANVVRHLTSGEIGLELVSNSLLSAVTSGKAHWAAVRGRLNGGTVTIWDTITKHKTLTFKNNGAVTKDKLAAVRNATRKVAYLVQMLTLNESLDEPIPMWKKDDEDCVARYELTDFATSLFTQDGIPIKAAKASFATSLYGRRPPTYPIPQDRDPKNDAGFFDLANFLQRAVTAMAAAQHKVMVDLVTQAVRMILGEAMQNRVGEVWICCDTYPEDGSAKDVESIARAKGKSVTHHDTISGRDAPRPTPIQKKTTLRQLLGAGVNKTKLCAHLVAEAKRLLQQHPGRYAGVTKVVLLNSKGPGTCQLLTPSPGIESTWVVADGPLQLKFPCVEADQLLLSAAKWWLAQPNTKAAMIVCDDTDVGVALLCYLNELSNNKEVSLVRGAKKGTRRRIDVNEAKRRFCRRFDNAEYGELLLKAAVGFHVLTGCDVTSYWYGSSKTSLWDTMEELVLTVEGRKLIRAIARLGNFDCAAGMVPEDIWKCLQMAACRLYKDKRSATPDQSRGEKMEKGKQPSDWRRLIFTTNSYLQQVLRADWMAEVWRICIFDPLEEPPSLAKRGFHRARYNPSDPATLCWMPVYKTAGNAPARLIQAKGCGCNRYGSKQVPHFCQSVECYCFQHKTKCTKHCRCRCNECLNGKPAVPPPAQPATTTTTADDDLREEQDRTADMTLDGAEDGGGSDEEEEPVLYPMDSLVKRKVYLSVRNKFKFKGVMYLVKWAGTDPKTGKAWPEKWEEMDHAKPGNISRSLDWDRLLSEFCKSTNTDPSVVMADRYRRNEEGDEELQSGDELQDDPDMSHSDESESEDSDGDSDESDSDREDEGQKEGHWQDESDSDDAPSDSDDSSSSDASEDGGSDSDADADIDEEMG